MEYTEDPEKMKTWAPLMMQGRDDKKRLGPGHGPVTASARTGTTASLGLRIHSYELPQVVVVSQDFSTDFSPLEKDLRKINEPVFEEVCSQKKSVGEIRVHS